MNSILHIVLTGWFLGATGPEIAVTTADELKAAVSAAKPGDTIVLANGTYTFSNKIGCHAPGQSDAPITVRAAQLGDAKLRFSSAEGFHVQAPHWVFENLDIQGVCSEHSTCEHAFHVTGKTDNTTIRGCLLHEYNAHIKGNGEPLGPDGAYIWPDDVLIEYNEMKNSTVRNTSNPVTPIDVVGGRRWILRGNFIHDHAKGQGNGVSYAAFLKGNSRDGLIERNLVICELDHKGQTRLGLSLGGGGSGPPKICEDSTCTPEHQNGILRNNIIVNCPNDVGVYLNKASNSKIYNNTLFRTTGIDVRFKASTADIRNNILDGKIRNRDGGTSTLGSNLAQTNLTQRFTNPASADFTLIDGADLVDKGEPLAAVTDDFCTNLRNDGSPDIGAVEYDGDAACVTSTPFVPKTDEPVVAEPVVEEPTKAPPDTPTTVEPAPDAGSAAEQPSNTAEGESTDTLVPSTDDGASTARKSASGGCQQQPAPGAGWPMLALLLLGLAVRQRRAPRINQWAGPPNT